MKFYYVAFLLMTSFLLCLIHLCCLPAGRQVLAVGKNPGGRNFSIQVIFLLKISEQSFNFFLVLIFRVYSGQ